MGKVSHTVLRFIDEQSLVMTADRVLIACSGGVDSVALLHFMASHRRKMGIEVAAVHVDHMLRGEESAEDGVHVKEICERLEIPFYGRNVPVPEMIERDGGNVQAVCRAGRYALFAELMRNESYNVLATGTSCGGPARNGIDASGKRETTDRYAGETRSGRRYSCPSVLSGYQRRALFVLCWTWFTVPRGSKQ